MNEPELKVDTAESMDKVGMTIMWVLGERELLTSWTREGMAHACAEVRVAGRRPNLLADQVCLAGTTIDVGEGVGSPGGRSVFAAGGLPGSGEGADAMLDVHDPR